MARMLTFTLNGESCQLEPVKTERARVYGTRRLEVVDANGLPCKKVSLVAADQSVLGVGSYSNATFSQDGRLLQRDDIQTVTLEGTPVPSTPSSFEQDVVLEASSPSELLDHLVNSAYALYGDLPTQLAQDLQQGKVFKCHFKWTAGITSYTGFVLANEDNQAFLLATEPANFKMVSLQTLPVLEEPEIDDDEMDFGAF